MKMHASRLLLILVGVLLGFLLISTTASATDHVDCNLADSSLIDAELEQPAQPDSVSHLGLCPVCVPEAVYDFSLYDSVIYTPPTPFIFFRPPRHLA